MVTNTNDSGAGSLRQAVADANAAPGADSISFNVSGTIALTSGAISINGPLTIAGPGARLLTVSGNRASGILVANPGSELEIGDLTLADGVTPGGGGAILNNGGVVHVSNAMLLRNNAFAGGAIENVNGGALTIENSTFSGNSALPGGAISNYASTATIVNSTFTGNAAVVGGALYNLLSATVRVTNSTFTGNSATGSPGAAIHNDGDLVIAENSIFAGNGCQGAVTDGGGNLDFPDSGCPGVNDDPELEALADNGGPTQTMAIGLGGGAIDAAVAATCPGTDQRGVARPFGDGCDIGAYESEEVDTTPPTITVPEDGVVADATSPAGAVVSFTASAEDDIDGPVVVDCAPTAGSTFPIGTTPVTCGASDEAGNEAQATFDVVVLGADDQLEDLLDSAADEEPGRSLTSKLEEAENALAEGNVTAACAMLNAFVNQVQAKSGKSIDAATADALIADATRIRAVLGCDP